VSPAQAMELEEFLLSRLTTFPEAEISVTAKPGGAVIKAKLETDEDQFEIKDYGRWSMPPIGGEGPLDPEKAGGPSLLRHPPIHQPETMMINFTIPWLVFGAVVDLLFLCECWLMQTARIGPVLQANFRRETRHIGDKVASVALTCLFGLAFPPYVLAAVAYFVFRVRRERARLRG
jgi:hypothetical protein